MWETCLQGFLPPKSFLIHLTFMRRAIQSFGFTRNTKTSSPRWNGSIHPPQLALYTGLVTLYIYVFLFRSVAVRKPFSGRALKANVSQCNLFFLKLSLWSVHCNGTIMMMLQEEYQHDITYTAKTSEHVMQEAWNIFTSCGQCLKLLVVKSSFTSNKRQKGRASPRQSNPLYIFRSV